MWNCLLTSCGLYYVGLCGYMVCDLCLERFYYGNEPPTPEYVLVEIEEN